MLISEVAGRLTHTGVILHDAPLVGPEGATNRALDCIEVDVAATTDESLVVLPHASVRNKDQSRRIAASSRAAELDPDIFISSQKALNLARRASVSLMLDLKAHLGEE